MKINLKILCIFLIVFYIIFFIYIIKYNNIERFTGILELLNSTMDNNKKLNYPVQNKEIIEKDIKKDIKFIYINNINDINNINNINNHKYIFYNKDLKIYMKVIETYNNYIKDLIFKDFNNKIIGNLISEKYNKIIIYLEFYKKNSNFEYLKNFKEIKFYLDNDDKYFFIRKNAKNDNIFMIYIFNLFIGKIIYKSDKKIYKIMCYEKYKDYLNLFGIGLILLLPNYAIENDIDFLRE